MATTPRAQTKVDRQRRGRTAAFGIGSPVRVWYRLGRSRRVSHKRGTRSPAGTRLARDRPPIVVEMSACPALESRARGLVPWSLQPIAACQNGLRQFGCRSAHCGTEQDEFDIAQVGQIESARDL